MKISYVLFLLSILIFNGSSSLIAQDKLNIIYPDGGEDLTIDSTVIIRWTGSAPDEVIDIHYSTNNGTDWEPVAVAATGLQYGWKVPSTISNNCLMRISIDVQPYGPVLSFTAHNAWINSASFSKNGQRFATASDDNTAKVWNINGQPQLILVDHSDDVSWVTFHPDGSKIATASIDNTAKIWDAATGGLLKTLSGHTKGVQYVEFSPDGHQVLTGSEDSTARIWDVETGEIIRTLEGHTNGVYGVTYSPDGKLIATASRDWTVKLWDVETGSLVRTLSGHKDDVHSVRFSPDGGQLVTGGRDSVAKIWDVASGEVIQTLKGHKGWVWRAMFSPDGTLIATASRDGMAKLWDAKTGQLIQTLKGHNGDVGSVDFNADGSRLLTVANDQTARVWSTKSASDLQEMDRSDASWSIFLPPSSVEEKEQDEIAFLGQNYPNPADKTTSISYDIAKRGLVELVVTDITGKEIAMLIKEVQQPGHYSINLNTSSLSSDTYLYMLKTSQHQLLKKMVIKR